jgi:ribosomal protein L37AE/L43A
MSELFPGAPEPVARGQLLCPSCGDREPQRIAYGYPYPEMWAAVERGEIVLGGCEISVTSPNWYCRRCGDRWSDGAGPSFEGAAAIWIDRSS